MLVYHIKSVVQHKLVAYSPLLLNSWTGLLNPLVKFAAVAGVSDVDFSIYNLLNLCITPLSALIKAVNVFPDIILLTHFYHFK